MDKLEFLIRQIAKTNKKNYENYVVTRIWHRLNNLDIKFVTQQYVAKSDGSYALTDMFFPQINLHVEVDEPHHHKQIDQDELRERDIVNVTQHQIERIDVSQGIEAIHDRIEELVTLIAEKVKECGERFVPWDLHKEINPQTYIDLGYIDVDDNVAFERIVDAVNCFGYNHKGFQKAGIKHPFDKDTFLWFPKLYPNGSWINRLSPDERVITERPVDPVESKEHLNKYLAHPEVRIVFARVKGLLGDTMYRFKGMFNLDSLDSIKQQCLVWRKVSDRVKTYRQKA